MNKKSFNSIGYPGSLMLYNKWMAFVLPVCGNGGVWFCAGEIWPRGDMYRPEHVGYLPP